MVVAKLCRNLLEYPRTTAALHLNSPRRKSSDTVASLLIAARLIITSAASPLAEQVSVDKADRICSVAIMNFFLLMLSYQKPLTFFPGLLTWRVEWLSRSSVGIFSNIPGQPLHSPQLSTREVIGHSCQSAHRGMPDNTSAASPLAEQIILDP